LISDGGVWVAISGRGVTSSKDGRPGRCTTCKNFSQAERVMGTGSSRASSGWPRGKKSAGGGGGASRSEVLGSDIGGLVSWTHNGGRNANSASAWWATRLDCARARLWERCAASRTRVHGSTGLRRAGPREPLCVSPAGRYITGTYIASVAAADCSAGANAAGQWAARLARLDGGLDRCTTGGVGGVGAAASPRYTACNAARARLQQCV